MCTKMGWVACVLVTRADFVRGLMGKRCGVKVGGWWDVYKFVVMVYKLG